MEFYYKCKSADCCHTVRLRTSHSLRHGAENWSRIDQPVDSLPVFSCSAPLSPPGGRLDFSAATRPSVVVIIHARNMRSSFFWPHFAGTRSTGLRSVL